MYHHIKKCTDAEGERQHGDDTWSISIHVIEVFVTLLYGRGAEGTRMLPVVNRLRTFFFFFLAQCHISCGK